MKIKLNNFNITVLNTKKNTRTIDMTIFSDVNGNISNHEKNLKELHELIYNSLKTRSNILRKIPIS